MLVLQFYLEHLHARSQPFWLLSPTLGNQATDGYFCNFAARPKGGGFDLWGFLLMLHIWTPLRAIFHVVHVFAFRRLLSTKVLIKAYSLRVFRAIWTASGFRVPDLKYKQFRRSTRPVGAYHRHICHADFDLGTFYSQKTIRWSSWCTSYSIDVRRHVLAIREREEMSFLATATRFKVGVSSLKRWSKRLEPRSYKRKICYREYMPCSLRYIITGLLESVKESERSDREISLQDGDYVYGKDSLRYTLDRLIGWDCAIVIDG